MKILQKIIIFLFFTGILYFSSNAQGVKISENSGSPHISAILEIESTTQGLLIPRMTSDQRKAINSGNPSEGLLVFDTEENSFFIFGNNKWTDLSMSSEIWSQTTSNVFLTNTTQNVGIGTINPTGKLVIKADALKADGDALFEIQDATGTPIFVVTSEGVRIYVKDYTTKGVSGGFAVGRYGTAKGLPDTTYLMVTPDSTRVYSRQSGVSGGFAVGRYGTAKGPIRTIFSTNEDSTRVYTNADAKGVSGGFAVGRYGTAKGVNDSLFFYTSKDKTRVYTDESVKGVSGGFAVGRYGTAKGPADKFVHFTLNNAFIGHSAGLNTLTGDNNIFIGKNAGINNTSGYNNVYIGNLSGSNAGNTGGTGNVFIGNQSGVNEFGDNKLFINNGPSDANSSLIYGNFETATEDPQVFLNGMLRFNRDPLKTITMPTERGALNEVLVMLGGGLTSWVDVNTIIPPSVNAPNLVVTYALHYEIDNNPLTTLVVKYPGSSADVSLPPISLNSSRIITIKNFMQDGVVQLIPHSTVFPLPPTQEYIDGALTSLVINKGESYTVQASITDGSWYIINKYTPVP